MTRLTRDQEIQRFFDEMEAAPTGGEIGRIASANDYEDELDATGKVTMAQLTAFGVVSPKTVKKHMAAGELLGRKVRVRGVLTWLFEPDHAKAYLEQVSATLQAADLRRRETVRVRASRPAKAPPGFVTVAELSASSGLSLDVVRDAITAGELPAQVSNWKGARIIAEADAARFTAANAGRARPSRRKGATAEKAAIARPTARERRPIVVHHREVLIWLILDQEGETVNGLARDLALAPQTVGNWSRGVSSPDDKNAGRLVAYARGRYAIRVGPELDALGKRYRADYMANYMRGGRGGKG